MRILDQALKHERYFTALTGLRIYEFQRLVMVTPTNFRLQTRVEAA